MREWFEARLARFRDAGSVTPEEAVAGWSLAEALEHVEQMESITELRMLGLTEDEADEFWHAVND